MDRRDFLKRSAMIAGAAALAPTAAVEAATTLRRGSLNAGASIDAQSILAGPAAESGIDTVVVMMMENRSFDAYLGWLAESERFLERGRSRYGSTFRVNGSQRQRFLAPDGAVHTTKRLTKRRDFTEHWHGCGHNDPGHGWFAGRAQRDGGFLAPGSGNDDLALSYMHGPDLPVYRKLATHFTVCDRAHASLLGPTYPNREYLLSAQSGGHKDNYMPFAEGGFPWETIIDRLGRNGVSVRNYYSDLPVSVLWGARMAPYLAPISGFHADAAAGTLPQVSYVDPAFTGPEQSDDHPLGDPRAAQRIVRDVFRSFASSPQWERGLFILTYDEWGGFFDHVAPPVLPDDRASASDAENFGQAGFRVPVMLASPRALPGFVDHRRYDHTSVIRFLEWRFLGAPPEGPGAAGSSWHLTARDRNANNIGRSLSTTYFAPDRFDLDVPVADATPITVCDPEPFVRATVGRGPFDDVIESGYLDRIGVRLSA